MHMKTIRILAFSSAVLMAASGAMAQITWDGNGDANNSGNWNDAVNWDTDTVPTSTENATLGSVTSGTRTVTVDVATTVNRIIFDQDNADGINKLSLSGSLTLNRTNASLTNAIWTVNLSGGATVANVVTDLNGYRIIVANANNSNVPSIYLAGTVNLNAEGSGVGRSAGGWFGIAVNGIVNVTANGSFYRTGTQTAGMPVLFNAGSQVNVLDSVFTIYSEGNPTSGRGLHITNNGSVTINAGATLSHQLTSNTTSTTGGEVSFTVNSVGSVLQAGTYEMKALHGNTTYTPNATITNNGTWTVDGAGAVIRRLDTGDATKFIMPAFNIAAAGTLRGNSTSDTLEFNEQTADGTRRMMLTNNGTIAPGAGSQGAGLASIGNLILRDIDVTMGSHANATVALDIGGAAIGQFDRLTLANGTTAGAGAGTLALDGNGTLQMYKVNGFDPGTTPFSITLIQAGSISGQFATVKLDSDTFTANELDVGGGLKYTLTYNSDSVVLSYIPEPGTVGLLLGGFALALIRRRMRG